MDAVGTALNILGAVMALAALVWFGLFTLGLMSPLVDALMRSSFELGERIAEAILAPTRRKR